MFKWLSRYLVFLRDYPRSKDEVTTSFLYFKFRTFKYIYVLYFLADLLHILSVLSKAFQ